MSGVLESQQDSLPDLVILRAKNEERKPIKR
jgi:hypothetical protein